MTARPKLGLKPLSTRASTAPSRLRPRLAAERPPADASIGPEVGSSAFRAPPFSRTVSTIFPPCQRINAARHRRRTEGIETPEAGIGFPAGRNHKQIIRTMQPYRVKRPAA